MSEFDKVLRGLSSREMLECARGLLACLTGGDSASGLGAAEAEGIDPVGQGGVSPAAGTSRGEQERAFRGVEGTRRVGFEFDGESTDARASFDWGTMYAESSGGRAGEVTAGGSRRAGVPYGAVARTARGEADAGAVGVAAGAAFCGPERRYDGAVGARGMEMSRVSEFFKRDSRRYDAGYQTFS